MFCNALALRAGTGTNACYVEKLENVELWNGDLKPPRQVRFHQNINRIIIAVQLYSW